MNRVVHFEIHAGDPQRAMAFYKALFGWEFQRFPGPVDYWLITTGADEDAGINGGLMPRRTAADGDAVIAYVCMVEVADLDAMAEKAEDLGAKIVVAKNVIPQVGAYLYCKDSEGNLFGMMQADDSEG
ncbi:MAG TPA: VOC family protein [Planctomycetota bacterium]